MHAPAREPSVHLVREPAPKPRPQLSHSPQSVHSSPDADGPKDFQDSSGLARFAKMDLVPLAQSLRPVATLLNLIEEACKKFKSGTWPVPQLLRPPSLRPRSFPPLASQGSLEVLAMQRGHVKSLSVHDFKHFAFAFQVLIAGPVLAPDGLDFLHGLGTWRTMGLSK